MANHLTDDEIRNLISRFYNLKSKKVEFLDAYQDANIKITVDPENRNDCQPSEFVLKLTKSDKEYIEIQIHIACYLQEHNISTINPVQTRDGKFVFKHRFENNSGGDLQEFNVYMLEYIPGLTVKAAGNPESLYFDIGRFIGKMDTALKDLTVDRTNFRNYLWELTCVTEIKGLLHQHCDKEFQGIVQGIIDSYQEKIVPNLGQFQKGIIHGDVNNCNIIVQQDKLTDEPQYSIAAIIDFGDACLSYYVYELATTMADFMTSTFKSHDITYVGKSILCGYKESYKLNEVEICHLRIIICVRLVQMYVLNSEASMQNPDNKYIQLEIEESAEVCKFLWNMTDEKFCADFGID